MNVEEELKIESGVFDNVKFLVYVQNLGDCPSVISLLMPFLIYLQTLGYNLPSKFSS